MWKLVSHPLLEYPCALCKTVLCATKEGRTAWIWCGETINRNLLSIYTPSSFQKFQEIYGRWMFGGNFFILFSQGSSSEIKLAERQQLVKIIPKIPPLYGDLKLFIIPNPTNKLLNWHTNWHTLVPHGTYMESNHVPCHRIYLSLQTFWFNIPQII